MSRYRYVVVMLYAAFALTGATTLAVSGTQPPSAHGAAPLPIVSRKTLDMPSVIQDPAGSVLSAAPDFIDASTGWIATKSGLLETSDGGTTWRPVHTPGGQVQAVAFANARTGWVLVGQQMPVSSNAGNQSALFVLYRTTDGGEAWSKVWSKRLNDSLQPGVCGLQVFGPYAAIVRAAGILYTTENKGKTWMQRDVAHQAIQAADFKSPTDGYAVTSAVHIGAVAPLTVWHTTDGGLHWMRQFEAPSSAWSDVSIAFDGAHGILSAWDTQRWGTYLYATSNSGRTWRLGNPFMQGRVFPDQPAFVTARDVLLPMGGGGGPLPSSLWASANSGQKFHLLDSTVGWRNLSLSQAFDGTIYGIATAGNGQELLKSTDAGRSWRQMYPAVQPMENISFVSRMDGFGLGTEIDPGAVLATTDGGASWKVVGRLPMGSQIGAMTFMNAEDGLAVMTQPRTPHLQVYRTADGGRTWSLIKGGALPKSTDPVIANMGLIIPASIQVFSPHDWMIGANGYPKLYTFHSGNNGASWSVTAVANDPPGASVASSFASATDGWMSVLRTPKSGQSPAFTTLYTLDAARRAWRSVFTLPENVAVQGMARVGAEDGWLVALNPFSSIQQHLVVYRTVNGGRTWVSFTGRATANVFPPPGLANEFALSFVNARDGWLLTGEGLLRTTNGGQSWRPAVVNRR